MSFAKEFRSQFGNPRGFWGKVAGTIMASRPSNRERNYWTLELLRIEPHHQLLEIGFGPGIAIARAAQLAHTGIVYGIDHSQTMLKQASKRNRIAIEQGRVKLQLGNVLSLPNFAVDFDRIYAVNSAQFWPEPLERFRELRDLLAPGGRIAITHQPRQANASNHDADEALKKYAAMLSSAGYEIVGSARKQMKPIDAICVLGKK